MTSPWRRYSLGCPKSEGSPKLGRLMESPIQMEDSGVSPCQETSIIHHAENRKLCCSQDLTKAKLPSVSLSASSKVGAWQMRTRQSSDSPAIWQLQTISNNSQRKGTTFAANSRFTQHPLTLNPDQNGDVEQSRSVHTSETNRMHITRPRLRNANRITLWKVGVSPTPLFWAK